MTAKEINSRGDALRNKQMPAPAKNEVAKDGFDGADRARHTKYTTIRRILCGFVISKDINAALAAVTKLARVTINRHNKGAASS